MLDIALKEWAVVWELVLAGRFALLLRKGGIFESGGAGVFELEHPRFGLFPSWAHQKPEMIKDEFRGRVRVLDEPSEITLLGVGEVAQIWQVKSRERFDTLDDLHPWTKPQIDMRFNYKPQNPLYLLAVKVKKLATPTTVPNTAEYGGCKSWVPLRPGDAIDDSGATPAMDDAAFAGVLERVEKAMA